MPIRITQSGFVLQYLSYCRRYEFKEIGCQRQKEEILGPLFSVFFGTHICLTKIQLWAVENNLETSKNTAIYRFLCAYSPTKQRLHLLVQYLSGNPVMVNEIIVSYRPISICVPHSPIKTLKCNIHPCRTKCTLWDNSVTLQIQKLAILLLLFFTNKQ